MPSLADKGAFLRISPSGHPANGHPSLFATWSISPPQTRKRAVIFVRSGLKKLQAAAAERSSRCCTTDQKEVSHMGYPTAH